jgi:hypothetical protein
VSQPNPEDPETRPFQPASYDLAPEFSVPPAQPSSGPPDPPPVHPQGYQPQPGYPQQPGYPAGYQQPGYQQPGYPPPGYPPQYPMAGPPVAPRKRRRGWLIGLLVVGVVLLGCCGVGVAVAAPYVGQYPSTIDAPSQLAGMDKIQNSQIDQLGQQLTDQLKRKNVRLDKAVAGLYAAQDNEGQPVLVVGATGLVFSPSAEVDNAFEGMSSSGLPVSSKQNYDAGALGGTVRCAIGSVQKINLSVCVWGDHGSVGMGLFYNRPVADSAALFLKIREAMLKRG